MTDETKPGSLGFFSSYDDLSDSSDSDDEAQSRKKTSQKAAAEAPGGDAQSSRSGAPLPGPDELFNSVSKPAFLYNPLNKEIDWDSLAVKAPEEVKQKKKRKYFTLLC